MAKQLHEYTLTELLRLPDSEVKRLHKELIANGSTSLLFDLRYNRRNNLRFKPSLEEINERISKFNK